MIRTALLGAAIAGAYGALHDQLSFTLAPEYFTKLKFRQFAWADLGWTPRVFASVVGFLASWWVGLIAGWLLARAGLAELPQPQRRRATTIGFGLVFVCVAVGGLLGWRMGVVVARGDLTSWQSWQRNLTLDDLPSFVVVAHLHGGGYIGALVGLIVAIIVVRKWQPHAGCSW